MYSLSLKTLAVWVMLFCTLLLSPTHAQETGAAYCALNSETVKNYIWDHEDLAQRLGKDFAVWKCREVGDGNLNLVFIIEGREGALVVKQALPYVRLVGESWPLPLSRAHFEREALLEQSKHVPSYVPAIYHHDETMALTVMEFLTPHIILRKGLIKGIQYPSMAQHIGEYLALSLYYTSDLALSAAAKREKMARFSSNSAMCKITEDLVFDEPYYNASMNHWTQPQLDSFVKTFRQDLELKLAAQEMKWRFLNHAEALIHGDLHTGSVMVTKTDTRVIDPEFAFYGPMGFDIGAVMANLFLAYFSQPGHAETPGARDAYAEWILEQIPLLWDTFAITFSKQWQMHSGNPERAVYRAHLQQDAPNLQTEAIQQRLREIWQDALGFAGLKMIRRIIGLAHVEDLESIPHAHTRAICEKRALSFARSLLVRRGDDLSIRSLIEQARQQSSLDPVLESL